MIFSSSSTSYRLGILMHEPVRNISHSITALCHLSRSPKPAGLGPSFLRGHILFVLILERSANSPSLEANVKL